MERPEDKRVDYTVIILPEDTRGIACALGEGLLVGEF